MSEVEAIYQDGVFKPLSQVVLPENERVRLEIRSVERADVRAWLAEVRRAQQAVIEHRGHVPDSAPDIAADRRR